ncbi:MULTISPECIES: TRAP transporter large permease [Alcaligenes]|jgi:tripartite ATP-independent transporter DctM subunit|uniref:TRAP transporter large permease protein n=2 Tax=Alcaligenes TaxID=507 RepID=A0AB33CU95_ALCFA|nr:MULTISPECIES: TRAP transporter large permease subunit [Alcaligenes]ASR89065.1 C4-dicarboxylate ABC transporter [Alcaligenes faecalis]AWG34049.1 C4-dicarboxylate ABC transporter [Alcaligenes aquatilis]MCC9163229.1 TRAP transporter large permease subunit [Alcaligenes sp. MMA]MCH4223955.1 TRAP transporter large permease subunit [Alcaligenes faecalis]QXR37176.1 TRAP transporter large permease subunit [Alcaligenes aquatilis]
MTPELIALLMGGLLLLGLFMGHPLAFVLGGTAVIGTLIAGKPMVLGIVVNRIYGDVLDNYTLIAIPLFILMARFLSDSEVTDKMFEALRLLMSRVRGGLALAVVFLSILLAATTGIIGASITVTGMMALRPMLKYGYCPKLTTGVIAASGCLGILIPPSIMLILMASYSPLSIGELFAGALIPGVLLGLLYAAWVVFIAWRHPERAPSVEPEEQISKPALIKMLLLEAVPPIFLILGILGSMLAGIATATEASAIGVLLSLLIVIFRGKFQWRTFFNALYETGRTSAMILFIVVGATAFTGVFNITGGLGAVQDIMRGLDMEPWLLIVVMLLIVFILGCFLDWTGIVLLSFPILLPIVQEMGVSLLWFVVLVAVVLQTSFLTPPFGYALFYLRAITPPSVKTTEIITGVIPFIFLVILMCILIAIFPNLVTWLPHVLYGS